MASSLTIQGDVALRRELIRLAREMPQAAGAALYLEGELIMTRAKEEYVPVDLGALKNSGRVHPPEMKGADVSVTLAFGGAAADYAIVQHERLDFKHTTGGAKYLERPLERSDCRHGAEDRRGAPVEGHGVTQYLSIDVMQEPFDLGLDDAGRAMIVFNINAVSVPIDGLHRGSRRAPGRGWRRYPRSQHLRYLARDHPGRRWPVPLDPRDTGRATAPHPESAPAGRTRPALGADRGPLQELRVGTDHVAQRL